MNLRSREPVYIIIPVHNRKNITLKCLETLKQCGDLDRYYTVVVDDGSTDGTSEAITNFYPEVTILTGDGNLWWTGAIRKGMEYAYEQGAEYFIWLNDDCYVSENAIIRIVNSCKKERKKIIGAQCYNDSKYTSPSYGGEIREGLKLKAKYVGFDQIINCDALDGNLVCMESSVVDDIGYPPNDLIPHYGGDNFFTWKAKKVGYKLELDGNIIAVCKQNKGDESWLLSDLSILELWQKINLPKSKFYSVGYWNFCLNFWGFKGILLYIKPYLRLAIISLLKFIIPRQLLHDFYFKIKNSNSI